MFLFSVSDINMGNKWGKTINRIELIVNLMKEGVLSEDKIISLFNLDMELKESGKYKNMKAMEFENFKLSVFEKRDNNNCETTIVEFYFKDGEGLPLWLLCQKFGKFVYFYRAKQRFISFQKEAFSLENDMDFIHMISITGWGITCSDKNMENCRIGLLILTSSCCRRRK
jgi:hypothetical protein